MARQKLGATDDKSLRAALAERDLELVSVDERLPDGTLAVSANKLCLIPGGDGKPLHAPIPVSLRIRRDARGAVRSLTGDTLPAEAIADATRFVEGLRANRKLAEAGAAVPPGATHQIEIDPQGRRVLRRRRFTAS